MKTMLDNLKMAAMVAGVVVLFPVFWVMMFLIGDDGDCQEPEFQALSEREKQRA